MLKNIKTLKYLRLNSKIILILLVMVLLPVVILVHYNYRQQKLEDSAAVKEETTEKEVADNSFNLLIPKIGITAPIITGVDPKNEEEYNEKLKEGVLLMPGTASPGEPGNVFIYGHSSAPEQSEYMEIFARLDDLSIGDEIKIFYQGVNYSYFVSEKKIVAPNDLSVLKQTQDETLALMTCWPIGTDKERLIIIAKK